ncbi:phosphate transporter [Mariannaea sp. PMI_226]|nr:phosphate transporter [Mariannaea sp. PMI_226]
MAVLHKYDYIFAITSVFAILDAWNIGANDVANSFATSVSSRSLTMKQAMLVATVCEFTGSVTVGSGVADTLRNKIVDPENFSSKPSVLLLAMMCTIIASSLFLTIATRNGMPVSTTHSVIGGLVGTATASVGIKQVNWGWDGVSQVFAAWVIAPGIAGCMGAFLFFATKKFVLIRRDAVKRAFYSIPFYTFLTVAALAMLISWKGVDHIRDLSTRDVIIAVFVTASCVTLLQAFFLLPFLWTRVVHEDWTLKWYHVLQGPLLLHRPPPPPTPVGFSKHQIKDYYRGHLTRQELESVRASETLLKSVQTPQPPSTADRDDEWILPPPAQPLPEPSQPERERRTSEDLIPPRPEGPWNSPRVLGWKVNRIMLRGLEKDVISMQKRNAVIRWDLEDMHARTSHYDNRAEYMYSALQILTAATASFTHGANDVGNAIAPFITAYEVWSSGEVPTADTKIPIWILCAGGASIVLGLLTYGYHVMRTLGNRLTLISPSRGFCMELASAATVLMATRLQLPVSTTQCITGATVGVGLANGDWKCINPKLVAWIYMGWIITVPVTAVISGCLMGLILNAPRWDSPI